ncbi:MAG: GNAT family N-acetyltransferase [Clostridia bacterium]|nr:GNAT family N-acetyltransferase [Clostridia bacterium]
MKDILIRRIRVQEDTDAVKLWNGCAEAGETLYTPMTRLEFRHKFFNPAGVMAAAEYGGRFAGFAHAAYPGTFPGAKPGRAYLTVVMVPPSFRGLGIGRALVNDLKRRMKALNAESLWISSVNPVNLSWRIPGTPGHGHNNMPGADMAADGFGFLLSQGFETVCREEAMYLNLAGCQIDPAMQDLRQRLLSEGIYTGRYDPARDYGFDRMCDRVGSEYWRFVLRTEIAAWKTQTPNADPALWADGIPPKGPRPLLIAAHEGEIIGFTGPVDVQKNGRGWFTGICVDPAYRRRGIGKALFHMLLQSFAESGASYTSLFTGTDNPARSIYLSAGMRGVRLFALMRAGLTEL